MVKLQCGNVLLKRSHRRQLSTLLRRANRLGERVGRFFLTISMQRIGKFYEVSFACKDAVGALVCRSKRHDWRDALRELTRRLERWLHDQNLRHAAV